MEKDNIFKIGLWLCMAGFASGLLVMDIICSWAFDLESLADKISQTILFGICIIGYIITLSRELYLINKISKGDDKSE